jgi:hypothetical protein
VDGKALCAGGRWYVVGRPITEIVARFGSAMEDADVLVVIPCQQALHFGIGARWIADQDAMLLCNDHPNPLDGRGWQFDYVA